MMQEKAFVLFLFVVAGAATLFILFNSRSIVPPDVPGEVDIQEEEQTACAQVITEAANPETGEVEEFPTPCDVPEGWEVKDATPAATM